MIYKKSGGKICDIMVSDYMRDTVKTCDFCAILGVGLYAR